jgi:hypothetical protein
MEEHEEKDKSKQKTAKEEFLHNNDNNDNEQKEKDDENKGDEQDNKEEEEEGEDEEVEINDPDVKELMAIDLANKDGVIELLMKDNLIKKTNVKDEKKIMEKNKAKFEYVESSLGKKQIGNQVSTYGRKGFLIYPEAGNPEFIRDMNTAANALKDRVEEDNQQVAKILFSGNSTKKVNKKITREQIDEKVKKVVERKKKNLQKIEAQMYEQQKKEETFTPSINHRKGEGRERRNLEKFLKDQSNFSEKIKKKREELLNEKQEEDNKKTIGRPTVDKNSEELAKKLNIKEEPAYIRLYNKRTNEKEKMAEKEKVFKERKKEEEKKRKEKFAERNKLYQDIQPKIDMGKKVEIKEVDEFGNIPKKKKEEINELEKEKERKIKEKMKKKGKILDIKDIPTNKILFNNFEKKFNEISEKIQEENLTEYEFHNLLFHLEMVSHPPKIGIKKEEEDEDEEKLNVEDFNESPIKIEEEELIAKAMNCFKDENNQVSKEIIKDFLICVLGLQKYDFYQKFKRENEEKLDELFPPNKNKKEDIPELMILKKNKEILSHVDKNNENNNEYAYRTNDGNIYISLEKGHSIKKDFSIFGLNYRNAKKQTKDVDTLTKGKKVFNFKPKINKNSEKLFQNYKDNLIKNTNTNENKNKDAHMEYIERIILQDKKRKNKSKLIKEEIEQNALKECTFKPKINQEYTRSTIKQDDKPSNKKSERSSMNRMIELYEKGTSDIKKKKNRTKEDIEIERGRKDLTFKPKTKIESKTIETRFTNDIYKEKEYKKLYERLKKGRMDRLIKNSTTDRYDLNKDLKKYVKMTKENKENEYFEEEKTQETKYAANDSVKKIRNSKIEKKESTKLRNSIKSDEEMYNSSPEQYNEEEDDEKREGLPSLIIDVNIRQGVKKKIYVYEGDTPESLSEKFAKEHNLEEETKIKLQNLIQSHMQKLLTRIDEENQSVSEKSQTTHNNRK